MYELDPISGKWVPAGWVWNGYWQRAEPASAYRLPGIPPFLRRGCEARPTSNTGAMRHARKDDR